MKKLVVGLVILASLAFVGYVGWRVYEVVKESAGLGKGRVMPPVAVELAPVTRVTLRDVGQFTGSLLADSQITVAPQVAGRLKTLTVNLGDVVKWGQLIAVLDDQEFVQEVERAKADLAVAKASLQECSSNLQIAQREFERAQTLREKKIASESDYDKAKADLEVQEARQRLAQAQVDYKEAALKEAQIRLGYTKIYAQWENRSDTRYVGDRMVDEGALLAVKTPIVSIIDIANLKAVVYVIERDYSKIAVGQRAEISTDAYPGVTFEGTIVRIAPQLQETSRQARVELNITNTDKRLKPGMFVRVKLEFTSHENALTIPRDALAIRSSAQGVFVVDVEAKTARFVPVEPGITDGDRVELLQPAVDGPVVVVGQHLLENGSAIVIPTLDEPTGVTEGVSGKGRP